MTAPSEHNRSILHCHRRSRSMPRVRLVCFPHAGGLETVYSGWEPLLPDYIELFTVGYRGRDSGSIVDIATGIADELAALPARPTALFGHSLGALIAYETACAAQRLGLRVPLFVSGARSPESHHVTTLVPDDGPAFVAALRDLGGTPHEVLDEPGLQDDWLPAVVADLRLLEAYRYVERPPLDCSITALVGRADPEAPIDQVRSWRAHTRGSFELLTYPGGHFYLTDQRSKLIADLLRRLGPNRAPAGRFACP